MKREHDFAGGRAVIHDYVRPRSAAAAYEAGGEAGVWRYLRDTLRAQVMVDGARAADQGQAAEDCPYAAGTEAWKDWQAGFTAALRADQARKQG